MYTKKSFNLIITNIDGNYKVKTTQSEYIDREGEDPIENHSEKEYSNMNIDKIQDQIEQDFSVRFLEGDELFYWFWLKL